MPLLGQWQQRAEPLLWILELSPAVHTLAILFADGMGTPSVPIIILSKIIINSVYDQWSFLKTLLILVFFVQCFNDAGEKSCGGDVLESEKNPHQDRWKFSGWLLCYSSLRPECWDCDGQQHDIHISHVSPENANYGRNQLQTLQIPALKKWKEKLLDQVRKEVKTMQVGT